MNWWQSSNSMVVISRMARNVCAPFFFEKKISHTGKSESHVIDGRCQQHTAPHTLCTRNIFSRVAPDRATGARLCEANSVYVCKNCLSFSGIMSRSHSSLLDLPPFLSPTPLLCFNHRGDHQPPNPRTAGPFGRLVIQSPLTKTSRRYINGVSTTQ